MALCSRPAWLSALPRLLQLPLKAFFQLIVLLWMLLLTLPRPHTILLQLPPALPTMAACHLAAVRHGARLVFDWHNFAYSLMAMGMGRRHVLVKLAEWYERYWGRGAAANLCVTRAMQSELQANWGVAAAVLYDRPPTLFRPARLEVCARGGYRGRIYLARVQAGRAARQNDVNSVIHATWRTGAMACLPSSPSSASPLLICRRAMSCY